MKKLLQLLQSSSVTYPTPINELIGDITKIARELKVYFRSLDPRLTVIVPEGTFTPPSLNMEFRKNFTQSRILVFSTPELAQKAFEVLPGTSTTTKGDFGIGDLMQAKRTAFNIFILNGRGIEIGSPPIYLSGFSTFKIGQQGYAIAA